MSVFQPGNTAVITGGASGIGLSLAAKCVSVGMNVLVADHDVDALAAVPATVKKLSSSGSGTLNTLLVDVSKTSDWASLKAAVDASLAGQVNLLALNAGVGGTTEWSDTEAFRRILDVNLWGVVNGIATLLPVVQATAAEGKPASVVITGSKQGITNPPGTSPAYNASKAAVRSLAEQLSFDLASKSKTPGGSPTVHLLVPGWTFTGLTGDSTLKQHGDKEEEKPAKPQGAWWPEQVVDYLVDGIAANKFYILCPDNDVTEEADRKRVLWSAGDIAEGRAPLSRWRPEYKEAVDAFMSK